MKMAENKKVFFIFSFNSHIFGEIAANTQIYALRIIFPKIFNIKTLPFSNKNFLTSKPLFIFALSRNYL